MNNELQTFLQAWDTAWAGLVPGASPAQRRAHFETVASAMRMPTPEGIGTSEHWIAVPNTKRQVRVRAFVPVGAGPWPTLIYMHGGAWMQGSPETHWDITSRLAAWAQTAVISVDYALAPEQPFPAAVYDCAAVVNWANGAGAQTLALRPDNIAVGGDSAGGNLAAALSLIFRDSAITLKAQLLIYPGVDFRLDRASHQENALGPIITVASMPGVNAAYCPNPLDRLNPLAAPLLAATHERLPPAYVAVAQHDPLRDEGLAYAERLSSQGVVVMLNRGPGLIHGYLRAMPWSDTARTQLEAMAQWLKAHLY